MHLHSTRLLIAAIALALCSCDASSSPNGSDDDGDGRAVATPAQPPGSGSGTQPGASAAGSGGAVQEQPAAGGDDDNAVPASPKADYADAPLVCPHCKSDAGGQTSDFGSVFAEPCPMPPRGLDAALEARFRVDQVRAAATRSFSQELSWGAVNDDGTGLHETWRGVTDDGTGLQQTWSDTTIDGEIALGEFMYFPCDDYVSADATVSLSTRDGKLQVAAHGAVSVRPTELGWPADAQPLFVVGAGDDLSSARGTLDLGTDPSKVQTGELFFYLVGSQDGVRGSMRVRLLEYPDAAGLAAAQTPTDTPGPVKIYERAAAQFPYDRCNGKGRPVTLDQPLDELGGGSVGALFEQLAARVGTDHPIDATELDGSAGRAIVELGTPSSEGTCAGLWFVNVSTDARAHSEDDSIAVSASSLSIGVLPYSNQVQDVGAPGPLGGYAFTVRWPNGQDAPSEGWIDVMNGDRELAWPPCTHAESCNPSR